MYKAKREIQGSKVRVIWGCVLWLSVCWPVLIKFSFALCRRVTRPHGSSGVVKSKFRSNLPPRAFGASVRVVRTQNTLSSHSSGLSDFVLYILDALPVDDLIHLLHTLAFYLPRIVCCNMTSLHTLSQIWWTKHVKFLELLLTQILWVSAHLGLKPPLPGTISYRHGWRSGDMRSHCRPYRFRIHCQLWPAWKPQKRQGHGYPFLRNSARLNMIMAMYWSSFEFFS